MRLLSPAVGVQLRSASSRAPRTTAAVAAAADAARWQPRLSTGLLLRHQQPDIRPALAVQCGGDAERDDQLGQLMVMLCECFHAVNRPVGGLVLSPGGVVTPEQQAAR
jgi:hypothetical protein